VTNNIYCIGRNFVKHIEELGNQPSDRPVVFMKPTHALVQAQGQELILPHGQGEVHFETELVIKMGEDYDAHKEPLDLIDQVSVGLDLTLRDLQSQLKDKQHPWLLAKGFENSAVIGQFIDKPENKLLKETPFYLYKNGEKVQEGHIDHMIFNLDYIIHFIGKHLGLSKGDLIYTGTPEGVGPLEDGDELELKWGDQVLGHCHIKSN